MTIDFIRDYCLAKQGVEESLPFGPDVLVFKVNGKIFLLLQLQSSPIQFNVKCNPDKAVELREQYDCVLPGYHMNKKHWNTIVLTNEVTKSLLCEWIDDSYMLIAKRQIKKNKIANNEETKHI